MVESWTSISLKYWFLVWIISRLDWNCFIIGNIEFFGIDELDFHWFAILYKNQINIIDEKEYFQI